MNGSIVCPVAPTVGAAKGVVMNTTKLAPGIYLANGTQDADGKPYCIWNRIGGDWVVSDSRNREVSTHFTKSDALASVEVAA